MRPTFNFFIIISAFSVLLCLKVWVRRAHFFDRGLRRWRGLVLVFYPWNPRNPRLDHFGCGLPLGASAVLSLHALHPWFSRTWSIAAKMSFQVCCFIMTSFGNMQPSQQMCLNFLVTLPLSSRIQ